MNELYLVSIADWEDYYFEVLYRPAGPPDTPLADAWDAAIRKVLADTADGTEFLLESDYFDRAVQELCDTEGYVPVEYAQEADEYITHGTDEATGPDGVTAGHELHDRLRNHEERDRE